MFASKDNSIVEVSDEDFHTNISLNRSTVYKLVDDSVGIDWRNITKKHKGNVIFSKNLVSPVQDQTTKGA